MLRLRDFMTTDVMTLRPDINIRLEFAAALPGEPAELAEGERHNMLEEHTVEEAMTRAP